ncbi:MAG: sulfite exporter TauE/SafE family protein [Sterolibacterium sp.]
MPDTGYISVFLIGLLGGTHCIAMCGGIVGAITVHLPGQKMAWPLHLAYNIGRIFSYALAGAAMGSIGSLGLLLNEVLPVQLGLYIAANLMLVALGLYLTGLTQALAFFERIGQRLWAGIQPFTRRFLPARSVSQALPLGILWGWLPCGMVYSVLTAALLSGSALRGAALMLAFGLGTLPNLLFAGLMLKRLRVIIQAKAVRLVSGLLVMGFGIFGLTNATTLGGRLWQGVVCHV